jgi:hypothetical protein
MKSPILVLVACVVATVSLGADAEVPPAQPPEQVVESLAACASPGSLDVPGCEYKALERSGWIPFFKSGHEGCLEKGKAKVISSSKCRDAINSPEGLVFYNKHKPAAGENAASLLHDGPAQHPAPEPNPAQPAVVNAPQVEQAPPQAAAQAIPDTDSNFRYTQDAAKQSSAAGLQSLVLGVAAAALLGSAFALVLLLSHRRQVSELAASLDKLSKDIPDLREKISRLSSSRPSSSKPPEPQKSPSPVAGSTSDGNRSAGGLAAVKESLDPASSPVWPPRSSPKVENPAQYPAVLPSAHDALDSMAERLLASVKRVGESGVPLTHANAAGKILSTVGEETARSLNQYGFVAELFGFDMLKTGQNPELLVLRFERLESAGDCLVLPFPQAGKVSRFNSWFENSSGEYAVNPVLARRAARGRIDQQGRLSCTELGELALAADR